MTKQAAKKEHTVSIIFGMGENERICGARFSGVDPLTIVETARKAGFKFFEVDTPELAEIARQMPAGRILGGGKLVVPPIKKEIYSALLEFLEDDELAPDSVVLSAAHASAYPRPKTWDEIAPGHLVIAQQSVVYGWWEAVVVNRAKDILTLRWRDYPRAPDFQQFVTSVALTPVTDKAAAASPQKA